MKASDVLYQKDREPVQEKRVDIAFETIVLHCGIGCIINDIPMDEADYVRLYLAFARLGKHNERNGL